VVICAMTGVVIVSSILAFPDISFENGGELTTKAFSKIPYIGAPLLAFGSLTFAFSTILGWSYYGERAVEYVAGKPGLKRIVKPRTMVNLYRGLFLVTVYLGAIVSLDLVWNLADIFNALMAIPNLISLVLLSGVIVKETRKYLWEGDLDRD
ncbi:MAG: alanine:cation symporter family protein, partial [Candidatus Cryptobacteroides sp.]